MRRIVIAVLTSVLLLPSVAACGPESCGRKDITRYVNKNGHTTVEHCVQGPNGLNWQEGK